MNIFREILFPVIAVISAFIVGGILILLVGDNPLTAYAILFGNAFGSPKDIAYTLFNATPLIFTGLAVALAFRCGLLNIGAEGQLTVAALSTAVVGILLGGTVVNVFGKDVNYSVTSLPAVLLVPLCILTAIVAGGLWGAIPGFLKARFGSHEVINTIMLNFIAIALVSYFTQYHLKQAGDPILQTVPIGEAAQIPRLSSFLPFISPDVPLNISFFLALLMCLLVYIFLWRTKWGYEIRAVGSNASAAEYGGISPKKQIILAMTISGALAGMVAIDEVLGHRYRYYDGFSDYFGFTGIAVALLGRNHPLGIILAALLFGTLSRGGIFVDAFTPKISRDVVQVLQGVVILFVAAEVMFKGIVGFKK
jgi:simple sugar transport system permease protein